MFYYQSTLKFAHSVNLCVSSASDKMIYPRAQQSPIGICVRIILREVRLNLYTFVI